MLQKLYKKIIYHIPYFPPKNEAPQLCLTLIIIINVSWAANQHISEGSCEDWSDDAENTALFTGINDILQYIHIQTVIVMY